MPARSEVVALESSGQSFRFLGCALAISLVLAFPIEQVIHAGYRWGSDLCSAKVLVALSLGDIVIAILTPLLVFLLPGPGSIFQEKAAPKPALWPWHPVFFVSAALVCASAIPVAWWYALRHYARLHNTCGLLFDLGRPVDIWHVDYLSDFAHYFIYFSVFSAFWVGLTAGGVRLQSARAAARDSARNKLRSFQSFYWACFLGWAVQYRLTEWCFAPLGRGQTEWVNFAFWSFLAHAATSLWVLAFIRSLWDKRPQTRREAVMQAFGRSFLIYLLGSLTLIWNPFVAGGILNYPLVTLNAFGFAWALGMGTWRWRALQQEQLMAAPPQV